MLVVSTNFLWQSVIGQKDAIETILASLASGGQSHAWLFVGPKGVGKWTTAKVMAAFLNCEDGGCGDCSACKKILRDIHPDVFLIEPEGNFILIEQVEALLHSVSLKNFEGKTKVIVIDEADKMTAEAANALLKTLEEPPSDVVFILVSANLEGVLPTIISRCRLVQFRAIPAGEMISFLVARHGVGEKEAALATRLSGGILGTAMSFAKSSSKKTRRRAVLGIAQAIDRMDLARVSFAAEELASEVKRPLDELKDAHKKELSDLKGQFGAKDKASKQAVTRLEQRHKREISREEHQGFEEILNILASWYRDLLLSKETGRDDVLTNQDHVRLVHEHAELLSSRDVYKCLQIIEETKQYLRFNVNMHLAFETMLFKIYDVVAVKQTPY